MAVCGVITQKNENGFFNCNPFKCSKEKAKKILELVKPYDIFYCETYDEAKFKSAMLNVHLQEMGTHINNDENRLLF